VPRGSVSLLTASSSASGVLRAYVPVTLWIVWPSRSAMSYSIKPESDSQMIDLVSQIIEDFVKTQGGADKSLDEIRQALTEANDEFPGELRQLVEGAFAETIDTMKQVVPQLVDIIPGALDSAVGVLSLTERPDHPLMWSHYANNHSGLVQRYSSA
jgi:hypothetical protein